MNRRDFLLDQDVAGFISWASTYLLEIIVDFDISKKGTGTTKGAGTTKGSAGPGLQTKVIGFNAVTSAYHWRGEWKNKDGSVISSDWASSRESLSQLSKWLKEEVASGSDVRALDACDAVLSWGGDRAGPNKGARPFLKSKADNGELTKYLSEATLLFSLDTADISKLGYIEQMNSMLTKVHALLSDDGLPIYDSRVAGSIASLVEIYRQSIDLRVLPKSLAFKAVVTSVAKDERRRVVGLKAGAEVFDPGIINRDKNYKKKSAIEWSSAKVRLAWLIEAILERAEENGRPIFEKNTVLDDTLNSRMHAFEAALFMIGFDVKSLSNNCF